MHTFERNMIRGSVTLLSEIVDWTETTAHHSEPPKPT